ncbi:MAG: LacI family DNA-binding transcriptional regulator [Oscillospiraceae bacterium]|nr:LacI family DNA-binding transcriptional regulator [Oscillospiraceae bacterium]
MTIKDIAQRCGVSVSTVSRVLNKHPDVSEKVRNKVMCAVEELHYVPNSSARDLVCAASDAIGLVVRGAGNPFFIEIVHAVERAINDAGYTMVLHQIRSGEDELRAGAQLARSKKLRGLILLGGCFDYSADDVALLDVPFVCCSYTNSFGHLDEKVYSSVTIDDRAEAYRAMRYLIENGHRRIAVLLESTDDRSISELRYMGYRQALEENGIAFDEALVLQTRGYGMDAAYDAVCGALEKELSFSALFCISDSMAVAAMKALHDAGRSVPGDCSVIAIDGIEMSAYSIPTLTTLCQPKHEMGETSVRLLLDMIEGHAANGHVVLETEPRRGGSVCRVCD